MMTGLYFNKILILISVIIIDVLVGMEFDLFIPSFPELQSKFNLSPFWVEALLSVNFVGYCLSVFFVGIIGDWYGRKLTILLGLATFIIGSMICLLDVSYYFLLIGRFLQGIGIAAPSILSFLIIADSYPIKSQRTLLAILNGFMNASIGVAPIVGSYLTLYFHWQGNFIVLLLLGVISFMMTTFFIPSYKRHKPSSTTRHAELVSASRQEPAETLKQSAYAKASADMVQGDEFRLLIGAGYIPIFQSKPLMLLILYLLFMFVPYWVFVGMCPILFMQDLGVSLEHFGYYQGAGASLYALGSLFCVLIVNKYDQKKLLYISNQIAIIALIGVTLAALFDSPSPLIITLVFIPFTASQVIPTTVLWPLALNFMPEAKGKVSAIIQGVRLIFCSLGLQLAGYYYVGSFQSVGVIISCGALISIITLFFVIKNQDLMKFLER